MDHNTFLKRLSEFCTWRYGETAKSPLRKATPKQQVIEIDEDGEEVIVDEIIDTEYSHPPTIIKMHHEPRPCDDCPKIVVDRQVHSRLCTTPEPHWRHHCTGCQMTYNPTTDRYDVSSRANPVFFTQYFAKKNK